MLQDYQVQMNGGFIVGAGQTVGLKEISGLRSLPDLNDADSQRGQMDGQLVGPSYLGARRVGFQFEVFDPSDGLEAAISRVSLNWQNIRDPNEKAMTVGEYLSNVATASSKPASYLEVQLPGRAQPLLLLGRPSRFNVPIDRAYNDRNPTITAEWKIPDGVLYDSGIVSDTCGLPNPVAGFTFPATAPFTFGFSTGGSVSLYNAGDYPTYPVIKITGPCFRPRVMLTATGEYININLTLKTGDVLLIDMQSKVVTYNGANRNNAVEAGSSFFMCPAGASSIGFQSSDSLSVAGQMSAYLLSTYSVI